MPKGLPLGDLIPQPEPFQIQVFHPSMVFWLLGDCKCRHVVNEEGVRGSEGVAKLSEQVVEEEEFLSTMISSNVLSLCGGIGDHILKLGAPADSPIAHLHHICTSGVPIVLVTTMVSITVAQEHLRSGGVWGESELVVHGPLQIAKEVLDSCPVSFARVGVVPGKEPNFIGNIWASGKGTVDEGSNCSDVGNGAHLLSPQVSLDTAPQTESLLGS